MAYKSVNPYTGETVYETQNINDTELAEVLEKAEKAFTSWSLVPMKDRGSFLQSMADLMRKQVEEHAMIITREMGKPLSQARAEVLKSADVCEYYAKESVHMLAAEKRSSHVRESELRYTPLGVLLEIMPWNFPYWQVFRFLAPALMAGNTAILKHASNVPLAARKMEELGREAGLPEGVFTNIYPSHGQIEQLIADPRIKGISLTGSNAAGSRVAEMAGKHLKKVVLELGGSDPFIVFEDADLPEAAGYLLNARFQNGGQSCIAAKRLIVHASVKDKLLKELRAKLEEIKLGNPGDEDTFMGPVVNREAEKELQRQLDESLKLGASVYYSKPLPKEGFGFFAPTVVELGSPDVPVWREEVFGPILPVICFREDEEALQLANDTEYGLGGTIWTRKEDRIRRFVQALQCGTVAVNGLVKSHQSMPFGGIKASGYGRELAELGIREFVNIKSVNYF